MVTSREQHPILGREGSLRPVFSEQAMHEPLDITTIIFALLAVFVVWKLRSVLGTRTGHEKQRDRPFAPRAAAAARRRRLRELHPRDCRPRSARRAGRNDLRLAREGDYR